jgi:hypothetical protein
LAALQAIDVQAIAEGGDERLVKKGLTPDEIIETVERG